MLCSSRNLVEGEDSCQRDDPNCLPKGNKPFLSHTKCPKNKLEARLFFFFFPRESVFLLMQYKSFYTF